MSFIEYFYSRSLYNDMQRHTKTKIEKNVNDFFCCCCIDNYRWLCELVTIYYVLTIFFSSQHPPFKQNDCLPSEEKRV